MNEHVLPMCIRVWTHGCETEKSRLWDVWKAGFIWN